MDPMQSMMQAGNAQSAVNSNLMSVDQPLMCSATIYSQDMSLAQQSDANMMHRSNILTNDMDPFLSNQQQLNMQQQQQLMAANTDIKDGYKGKFCRGYLKQHQ